MLRQVFEEEAEAEAETEAEAEAEVEVEVEVEVEGLAEPTLLGRVSLLGSAPTGTEGSALSGRSQARY